MTPAIQVVQRPTTPADHFRCTKYRCVLPARDCVLRQQKPARNRHTGSISLTPFNAFCRSGQCGQGKATVAALAPRKEEPAA